VKLQDRAIIIFHIQNHFYALDSRCHHRGAELMHGDIEDFGGHLIVKCPYHLERIELETGEGYTTTDTGVKSKGKLQRIHTVKIDGDNLYVSLSTPEVSKDVVASDFYQNMDRKMQPLKL